MSSSPRKNLLARSGDRCRRGEKSALTVTLPGQAHPLVTAEAKLVICDQTIDAMRGHQAHIDFDSAIKDFPAQLQGIKPLGAPHTAWQLLEHMRIAQNDILEFSRNPEHKSPKWPDGYWPDTEVPPTSEAWSKSVSVFQKDAEEMLALVKDPQNDLFQPFAHGDGQTLLREALLIASHNSYHLGQLMYLKKTLSS